MPFNFYDTHTLLMAVQQLAPAATFLRDRYFPTNDASDIFATEDVLVEYRDGVRKLAPFVAPRKGGVTILRKGYTMERYTPPFVAPRRTLTLDELRKRGFGEALYSQLTPEQDPDIKEMLDNRRYELGSVAPEELAPGASIMARLNINGRIISVISYDETYTDDDGNDQLYIPSGKCILTAPAAGRTCYGAVSQVEQADGEFHTYAGRRVPKYVSSAEGNTRTLTISSRPLLIPNNKNPWIVADVLGE